jgi:Protein of unknown function (DUF3040)
MFTSLSSHEKRLLSAMEEALRRSAPHLASMAATFAAVVAEEPMPDHEDLRRPAWRWLAALAALVAAITRPLLRVNRRGGRPGRRRAGCGT